MIHAASTRRSWLAGLLGFSLSLASFATTIPGRAADLPIVIFAAASLKNALDEATAAWGKETGKTVKVSYAGSNALAKQLESGAPADIFWSADQAWMDYAQKSSTIRPDTRTDLLRNAIVLVAAKDSTTAIDLKPGVDVAKALGGGRLAMGNVDAVPAGKYGKAALTHLGAWEGVKDKVAQAENVRAALLLVSRGEAPLGIVYASDAVSEPGVKVVATFPADSHPPIVYPIARTKDSANEDSVALLKWLQSPAARPFFEKQGFTVMSATK
ncbi:Molybdate-binding protein ModA [Methylobacterium gnaphalii]|uniref:Molybdate ABC transporter substrate-binding protein n=1 Tax=Methylobacterium gnaphalii TaxID=1010610 RepID=A0A512JL45_9HYPH|nr:molybdate ABC transporter substrate-binding protein [Methylobacterium gnaphalii]GEP10686.1 molybdate ABC transporter substrate-binding protein [Methylobacterium gnaphalii]GJD67442.1 Molybdate-binding protein ModA [Methylobacterium gnaphalii]GLS47278.1 molybdate ABC transporter substrate-binding protein [Methylobacterium gnaphalii]